MRLLDASPTQLATRTLRSLLPCWGLAKRANLAQLQATECSDAAECIAGQGSLLQRSESSLIARLRPTTVETFRDPKFSLAPERVKKAIIPSQRKHARHCSSVTAVMTV